MAKITIETEECIGCGSCAALCSKFWDLSDDDMKAHIKDGKKNDAGEEFEIKDEDLPCNMEAAEACPVNCIHVFVNDEKKI